MSTTMIKLLRRALIGALAAGLVGATLVAPTASAEPVPQTPRVGSPTTPDGAGKVPTYRYEYRKLSKAKKADASAAGNIISKATSKKAQVLDYKKANKYDKGRTTARRQVAAAYLWAGKKVTNLSKAEKKKVVKYLPKKARPKPIRDGLPDGVQCEGKSGWKSIYDKYGTHRGWAVYLDSCESTNLKGAFYGVGFVTGIVAISTRQPQVAATAGVVSLICGLGAGIVEILQFYSTVNAIFFLVLSSPIGITTTAHPQ